MDEDHDLGWPEGVNQAITTRPTWGDVGGDAEPCLGSLDAETNQVKWSRGNRHDLEEQCEDEGHDSDREAEHDGREPPCAPFELVQDGAP